MLFGLAWTLAAAGSLPAQDAPTMRWVLVSEDSEARYRVREQLAGFDFPNDAVGTTRQVSGEIHLAEGGAVVPDGSIISVDLASLTTDNQRRDGYVRRRTLEVDRYPTAVLVPNRMEGLPFPLPSEGSATFTLEGELTLHGVTAPTVWEVTATFGPRTLSGLATTTFTFETFGIAKPSVARVLSVDDDIRLELAFTFAPETP
jgi:polyisoprenoid-binding protein YceI